MALWPRKPHFYMTNAYHTYRIIIKIVFPYEYGRSFENAKDFDLDFDDLLLFVAKVQVKRAL